MEQEKKKKLILIGILLVVLVTVWAIVLSPGKKVSGNLGRTKSAGKVITQPVSNSQQAFKLEEVERTVKQVRDLLKAMEEKENQGGSQVAAKDPFLRRVQSKPVVFPEITRSILKEEPARLPSFVLSGILYDRARPLAIINEKVCSESEQIEGFQVYEIRPDSVVLKNREQTLTLQLSASAGTEIIEQKMITEQKKVETTGSVVNSFSEESGDSTIAAGKEKHSVDSWFRTIQVLSVPAENIQWAREQAQYLVQKGFERVRLLKDDEFVVLRSGLYKNFYDAKSDWKKLAGLYRTAFIKKVTIDSEEGRILEKFQVAKSWPAQDKEKSGEKKQTILTIQVASYESQAKEEAVKMAEKLVQHGYPDVRVENINGFYAVRIGRWMRKEEFLTDILEELKQSRADSFLRTGYYLPERIVYLPGGERGKQPDEGNSLSSGRG